MKPSKDLKSSARVNPATLAMEFSLPLGVYPGRAGNANPIALKYSSKVWTMKHYRYSQQENGGYGTSNYPYLITHRSSTIAEYSKRAAAGWTSSLQPVSILPLFNYLTRDGFPVVDPERDPDGECTLNSSRWTYDDPECPGGALLNTYFCPVEGEQFTVIVVETVRAACLQDNPGPTQMPGPLPLPPGVRSTTPVPLIKRVRAVMPDGSTVEFRKDDKVYNCSDPEQTNLCPQIDGSYIAVDGSGMRIGVNEDAGNGTKKQTLYLPDGSRYVLSSEQQFIDRHGNRTVYNSVDQTWTDSIGQEIVSPLPFVPHTWGGDIGTKTYSLPSVAGQSRQVTQKWQKLIPDGCENGTEPICSEIALENPEDTLLPVGSDSCASDIEDNPVNSSFFEADDEYTENEYNNGNNSHYHHTYKFRICGGDSNPVVLHEINLPDGSKYKFRYNTFGEITRIIYPTGAYERFQYGVVPSLGLVQSTPYAQTNRGVLKHWISEDGVSERLQGDYSPSIANMGGELTNVVTMTAHDNSKTERRYLFGTNGFGFDDPVTGKVKEENVYSAPDQQNVRTLLRRTLNEWTPAEARPGGHPYATRDARLTRSVNIIFENGKALATLTKTEYDETGSTDPEFFSHLNVKRQIGYHYKHIPDLQIAETGSLSTIAALFGQADVASATLTDYAYDPNYKARGILGLPIRTRVLNPATLDPDNPLATTETIYDNALPAAASGYSYSMHGYGTGDSMDCSSDPQAPKVCWQNPNGANGGVDMSYRGLPTTTRVWFEEGNEWIETHTQYDQFGNPVKVKSPSGNEATTVFSAQHKYAYPTLITTPAPDPTNTHGTNQTSTVQTTYDFATGLATSVTDDFGQVTTTTYDNMLRPRFVNPIVVNGTPTGPVTETQYGQPDANGQFPASERFVKVRKQIDASNWDEAITWFDALGRTVKTQAKDSQGDVFVETTYDNVGRPFLVTNPYRAGESVWWNKTKYDAAGRAFKAFAPASYADATAPNEANLVSLGTTAFDISTVPGYVGTVVTTTDASERKGRSITNALGQLIRVDEPHKDTGQLGEYDAPIQPTSYKYDAYGKMVHVQQGDQNRYFKYDSLGRLLRVRQPEQEINQSLDMTDPFNTDGDWTAGFTYDILGNVLTATDANGVTITNTYDRAGRVKTRTYSGEPAGQQTPAVSFYYDGKGLAQQQTPNFAKGKLTKVTSSISETQYTLFDNFGRLTESKQITDGQTYTSGYQYNFSGALVQETYPSGRVVKNDFESDGDLLTVTSKKAGTNVFRQYASSFSYTASGGISQMRLGNGKWETAKFNNRLQVEELGLEHSAANAGLWKVNYAYGELAQNGTDVDAAKNTGNIAKQTLTIPSASFVQTYRYDSLYRLREAVEPGSGTPNWTQTFDYDRYGNRTAFTQTVGGTTTHNSTPAVDPAKNRFATVGTNFQYDLNGNLIKDAEGRQFTFNGDNKQTEVRDAANNLVGQYFYDGEGKRVKKVVGDETTVFVYSSGKLVAEYSTQLSQNPTISYTTTDHLGSPRIITDQFGQVKSRRDFMPFGEDLFNGVGARTEALKYSASGDDVKQKFTGYLKDNETGLDFAEARMYENRFGRFTAVDPLLASGKSANPQTFNRFIYVGNNPLTRTDPTGLDWFRRATNNKDRPYEFKWYDDDPGGDWSAVNFGFFGQYFRVENFCINDDCRSAGYLYRDGGADFGEQAQRIDGYGFGDALKDTGIAGAQVGYNTVTGASNLFWAGMARMHLQYFTTGRPLEGLPYYPPWGPENQTQANAQLGWTAASFFLGGFGSAARRPMFSFGASTTTTPATVAQYEVYSLRAARNGLYPVMQRGSKDPVGSVFLNQGDIWKYGETINPATRYSGVFLRNTGSGLRFVPEVKAPTFKDAFQIQKQSIIDYEVKFGKLPPGNKIRG